MSDPFHLYISASAELAAERAILSKSIAEIPVDLGWIITYSPTKNDPLDIELLLRADFHTLILGSDIRAPVGLEYQQSLRSGKAPVTCLKTNTNRTLAANEFLRFVSDYSKWQLFADGGKLLQIIVPMIIDNVLGRAGEFKLTALEITNLENWKEKVTGSDTAAEADIRGGTGESSVILSVDRFTPSDGVLIDPVGESTETRS